MTLTDQDRQALRDRYAAERDKRIRADGNEQYQEPSGRFANLLDDTYVQVQPREVLDTDVHREGITGISAADISSAHELGYIVKLLAIVEERDVNRLGDSEARARALDIVERSSRKFTNDSHADDVARLIERGGEVGPGNAGRLNAGRERNTGQSVQ